MESLTETFETRVKEINKKMKEYESGRGEYLLDYPTSKSTRDLNERLFVQLSTNDWARKLEA